MLSISRGLILFLTPAPNATKLTGQHGLKDGGWDATLAAGIHKIPELHAQATAGTFTELLAVTRNTQRSHILSWPFPATIPIERDSDPASIKSGLHFTLKDVLARMADLAGLYETTFAEHSKCYPGQVHFQNTQSAVSIYPSRLGLPEEAVLRTDLQLPPGATFTQGPYSFDIWGNAAVTFTWPHANPDEGKKMLPPVTLDQNGHTFITSPFADGTVLSSLALLYVLAYITGMLARYFPSRWAAANTRSVGDSHFPLLNEALSVLERNFPQLVVAELELAGDS